jgi:SAM-dependent methyltransferase
MTDASGPNAEQITYWNEQSGLKWVARQEALDRMIGSLGERAMAALAPRPGERLIDVGCGCGSTSLELARRVTASGSVQGVDVSGPMLGRARERATAAGVGNVHFVLADAQTHRFAAGAANGVFSRFGVMFFADPTAAFANLRTALEPDGRLTFVCWQPMAVNPWLRVPLMAIAGIVPLPPPPAPDAPGPFAFGDRDRVVRILDGAGFRDVTVEALETDVVIGGGGDLDESVRFALELGPTGAVLRTADPALVSEATRAVRDALAPFAMPRGVVMPSAAWVVSARR